MNKEHKIKIESRDLPFMQDGYRCSCGEGMVADSMHKARRIHDERLIEKAQDKTGNDYIGKVENGFYETFKKELPQFHSDHSVTYVVGECMRAARRAEMKVSEHLTKYYDHEDKDMCDCTCHFYKKDADYIPCVRCKHPV